jgi:hypothetical protein
VPALRARSSRPILAFGIALAAVVTAACTGTGGGWLPPDGIAFAGKATLGFSFSCERSSNSVNTNPPAGRLKIELSYADQGTSPIGSPFGVHGTVDTIDPVVESAACIGQNAPPGGNELIFLGRYRLTNGSPTRFANACVLAAQTGQPLCRFQVIVRDNDGDLTPSTGDFFSIQLSTVTDSALTEFPVASVFYARAGVLGGGNINVD